MQIIKFGAVWCAPCKALDPILDTLPDDIPVIRYDIDDVPDLAAQYHVRSVPTTFLVSDEGSIIDYKVGTFSKSQLDSWVRSYG